MSDTQFVITVDATSFVPPYEQVRSQLAAQISGGDLVAGTKLPTVRRLADDLGLAVNTVARAYRELEAAGLVATAGRAGTVVTAAGDASRAQVEAAARSLADLTRTLGIGADEAVRMLRAAFTAHPST
jgi:DNA-binding transcriptional regulator YhcF (GntR family)